MKKLKRIFIFFLGALSRILYLKPKKEVMWDYPNFQIIFFLVLIGMVVNSLWAYEIKDDREVTTHKPVNISSAGPLTYDRFGGLTVFKKKVRAIHDKVVLTSDEIRAMTGNREATAEGNVQVVDQSMGSTLTCGNLEYQDYLNTMTAHDHPLLTSLDENGRPITVSGRQMEMDSKNKTVIIHQNVKIINEDGKGESQKATFLAKEDKFILEEEPSMTVPNGKLTGRRIISNLGVDRGVIVEGMADAVFYPVGMPAAGKGGTSPTSPKAGQHQKGGRDNANPAANSPDTNNPTGPAKVGNHP